MIVTIDGPAGAGKSSAARALARRLGFRFLDTGAMYRAVAWAGHERRLAWDRPDDLAQLARQIRIELFGERVLVDGQDVTREIRTSQITGVTHFCREQFRGAGPSGPVAAANRTGLENIVTEGARSRDGCFSRRGSQSVLDRQPLRTGSATDGRSRRARGKARFERGSGGTVPPRRKRPVAGCWSAEAGRGRGDLFD